MKLLVFAEYVRSSPVAISHWAIDLCQGLHDRGHKITLALDGAEDCDMLAGRPGINVRIHNPLRDHLGANPFAFQNWAERQREKFQHDRSLSLTPLVPADLWLPLGPGAWDNVKTVLATQNPIAALSELAHQPWLPALQAAERLAVSSRGATLTFGFGAGGLGYASRLDQPLDVEVDELRARVRAALKIAPDRPVLLVSAFHAHRPGLRPFLTGFSHLCRDAPEHRRPVCLIIGRSGESIAALTHKTGCAPYVRMLGRTERIVDMLAACDLVAAPLAAARHGRFGLKTSSTTGRFIADALRIGRPVIALNRAAGAELLNPSKDLPDPLGPGWIVDNADATQWSIGLTTATSQAWLSHRTPAARRAGAELSMSYLIARIERVLTQEQAT